MKHNVTVMIILFIQTTLLLMVTLIDHSLDKGIKQDSEHDTQSSSIKSNGDIINNAH